MGSSQIKSVAIIGAGASGAIAAAALEAEQHFDHIRIFERRQTPGGAWIYDPNPGQYFQLSPGKVPPETDPPLEIPRTLPHTAPPSTQERYTTTPVYSHLTTNIPDLAMSYSDSSFAYGPFVPHWVPKQYIENYFSSHQTDKHLVLNTSVEDLSQLEKDENGHSRWSITLRRLDPRKTVDEWWNEEFDAVVIANGRNSVPYVPMVEGLDQFMQQYPNRVLHSKQFRSASDFAGKKVLVVGNSSSGLDVSTSLTRAASLPVYQSRRTASRLDADTPPPDIAWRSVIKAYLPSGKIAFDDGSVLSDIDNIIYCTGYKASFPFWNVANNGQSLYNYDEDRLNGSYLHTFFREFPALAIIGLPRTLTWHTMEHQAVAVARVWAGRNSTCIPPKEEQEAWEKSRLELTQREKRRFHGIRWRNGETREYFQILSRIAGLPTVDGVGRYPPVLSEKIKWTIENVRKHPKPEMDVST